jgi:phospholipase C
MRHNMKWQLPAFLMLGMAGIWPSNSAQASSAIKHVIVIAMENTDSRKIYGNEHDAPFINSALLPKYAHATNFVDELPNLDSEPHYLWMEAGTNTFADHTFKTDEAPSKANSTSSSAHVATQLDAAHVSWMTYQEGQNAATGACPIEASGHYAPKHDPFVFFQDISGNPPSKKSATCAAHSRPYESLTKDLAAGSLASYVFITPNLCHDMHDRCGATSRIWAGDNWLKAELPRMIKWAASHRGVIFVTWDEGHWTGKLPFLAIGPGVKPNYASAAKLDHGSMVKSIEMIFGLPQLDAVSAKADLSDLFQTGQFP